MLRRKVDEALLVLEVYGIKDTVLKMRKPKRKIDNTNPIQPSGSNYSVRDMMLWKVNKKHIDK